MIEILEITILSLIFYIFVLSPKLISSKSLRIHNNINTYLIDNLSILLFLMTIFSILRLNLFIPLFIFSFLILLNLLNKHNFYFLFFKKNIKQILILFFLVILFNFELANNAYLGFDAQAVWFKKAYLLKNNLDPLNSAMPNYPFMGSYIWAFFWKFSMLNQEYYGRFAYIIIFFVSLSAFLSLNKNKSFFNFVFLGLVVYYIFKTNYLFNGYQDILVFSLLIIFFHYFLIFLQTKSKKSIIFLYILAFILSWVKNEANIYTCFLLFSLFFLNSNKKFLIINLIMVLLIFVHKILVYKYYFGLDMALQTDNYSFESFNNLQINLNNILFILFSFIKVFFKNLIIVLSIPLAFYFILNQKIFSKNECYSIKVLYILFCFLIAIIFTFYIFTSLPLEWHLSTSLDRLVFQISSILIYPFIIIFNKLFRKKENSI